MVQSTSGHISNIIMAGCHQPWKSSEFLLSHFFQNLAWLSEGWIGWGTKNSRGNLRDSEAQLINMQYKMCQKYDWFWISQTTFVIYGYALYHNSTKKATSNWLRNVILLVKSSSSRFCSSGAGIFRKTAIFFVLSNPELNLI